MDRIVALLLQREDPVVDEDLFGCLAYRRDQAAAERLLRLARSDKPWLWWEAIEQLNNSEAGRTLFKSAQSKDPLMRRRWIALHGRDSLADVPGEEIAAADRLLTRVLSPRFLGVNLPVFADAYQTVAERLDEETAGDVMLRFLRKLVEQWHKHRFAGRAPNHYWGVDRAVKFLNHTHGLNLGGLGDEYHKSTPDKHRFDWKAIAEQALVWAEEGVDPSMLPSGWEPGEQTVRLVWLNRNNPELSGVGILTPPIEGVPQQALSLELEDEFLTGTVEAFQNDAVRLEIRFGVIDSHSRTRTVSFSRDALPRQLQLGSTGERLIGGDSEGQREAVADWPGNWQVWIEPGRASDGVLAGTDLFKRWKQTYLAGPLEHPEARVFANHQDESVR